VSIFASEISKKLFEGAVTAGVLALLLFGSRGQLGELGADRHNLVPVTSQSSSDVARHVAFVAAQRDILTSLPADIPIGWCSETAAVFTSTPAADFVALQAVFESRGGKALGRHWIVRLDPHTHQVLGKIAWEE
jgi:hypothetical protein